MTRSLTALVAALAVGLVACSGSSSKSSGSSAGSSAAAPAVTVSPAQLADPGLPSQVGPPPLSTATLKTLMQYFEDQVSSAYANGDADALYHYLAGTMLTGNRATINFLNTKHQRNVLKITVNTVTIDSSDNSRIVFDINGDMTVNYIVDTQTSQPIANGLSNAGPVNFTIFLDFNPTNRTWYWTGEQSLDNQANQ